MTCLLCCFFFSCFVDHRDLHSFPTRRSSDLESWTAGLSCRADRIAAYDVGQRRSYCPRESQFARHHLRLEPPEDRKSTRLNSSHEWISYAVFCLKKKNA